MKVLLPILLMTTTCFAGPQNVRIMGDGGDASVTNGALHSYVANVSSSGISAAFPLFMACVSSAGVRESCAGASSGLYLVDPATFSILTGNYLVSPASFTISGDNLGNHVATTTLQMGAYGINTSSNIVANSVTGSGTSSFGNDGSGANGWQFRAQSNGTLHKTAIYFDNAGAQLHLVQSAGGYPFIASNSSWSGLKFYGGSNLMMQMDNAVRVIQTSATINSTYGINTSSAINAGAVSVSSLVVVMGGAVGLYSCNGGVSINSVCRGNGCSCTGGVWVDTGLRVP